MHNKILLSAVNAKFIHSNLAVRYLKKYCETQIAHIHIAEFSINDSINSILKKLYSSDADIYGFSCYIWNIDIILKLCSSLKKVKPEAVIILGGPEVSYDPACILKDNTFIEYVIIGEGEASLLDLLDCLTNAKNSLSHISGIAYREGQDIVITPPRPLISDLDILPFPYESFDEFENKIIYYETSRGCPFNCQYCLSSTIHGVRYMSMDRLKSDILRFVNAGIRQVKLVDRTFNCDIMRSIMIMEYIIGLNATTNFHFEIAADLINQGFLNTVRKAPKGMYQFEIGVQSTNSKTLSAIKRKMDFDKVRDTVTTLMSFKSAHIHLDLIAGLPYEDMISFEKSFNDVYALKPDMLQLGFLKLLKGSGIRESCSEYGIVHNDFPPYEVLKTRWLSYKEMLLLKDIEHVLEQYYNSGRFRHSLDFLLHNTASSPFMFYRRLSEYWSLKGHFNSSKSINELYIILMQFSSEVLTDSLNTQQLNLLNEYLKLDWLLYTRSGSMPALINRFDHSLLKDQIQEYLKNSLPEKNGFEAFKGMSMREALKHIGYEIFLKNIFDDNAKTNEVILFYPLKQDFGSKTSTFTTIPLVEVAQKV